MLYEWDIVGHKQQLLSLEKDIQEGCTAHAYLFSGVKQSGKSKVAKIFATILQCPNNFCKTCKDCKLIESGTHPDVMVLKDNGESIKIDEVRELIRKTNLTSQGRKKIIVIENIERMPVEAQNSFLKTLEEPPAGTIFILTSSQIDQVLLTIQSRVRNYTFSTTSDAVLRQYLHNRFGESFMTDDVINMAQGRPGLAISLMKDENALNAQKNLYNKIETFLKRNDLSQKFSFVEAIEKDPQEVELFLDAFTRYLRKLVFDYMSSAAHPLARRFDLKKIVNLFEVLEKTRYFIKSNVNKKLALENFLIQTEKN